MKQYICNLVKMFHIYKVIKMEEKIEIMNLLQSKQVFMYELKKLAYGSIEIK